MQRTYSVGNYDGDRAAMKRSPCKSASFRPLRGDQSGEWHRRPAFPGRPHSACTALEGRPARGFTLAETAMAVLLVSLLVVGSLQSLSASFQTHKFNQSRIRASFLAEQLLVEISSLSWSDPQAPATAGTIGRDTGDPSTVTRRDQLDDMDDFDDWSELPPATRTGSALAGITGLRRQVSVENISTADPTATVADNADTGIRRVTVMVDDNGTELGRVSALLTRVDSAMRSGIYEQRAIPNAGGN